MDTRFAISEYPNAAAITAQLDALIKKPIYSISRDALNEYIEEYFNSKNERKTKEVKVNNIGKNYKNKKNKKNKKKKN